MSGSPAPRPTSLRRLFCLGSVFAAGLTMVAMAVAGLAGLDGRLAAMTPDKRAPAAAEAPASNTPVGLERRPHGDCPVRES